LSPLLLLAVLLPSLLMYLLEAYGWRLTLGVYAQSLPFSQLFFIRTAGEVVNMTTPTAYVGGEPLKAYLLKRYHIPILDGLASVVIAKTTMTIAQIGFILLGIALAFGYAGVTAGSQQLSIAAGLASIGLLLFGTTVFVTIQRRGLFMSGLQLLRWFGIHIRFLESREARLQEVDGTILRFYRQDRRDFILSTVVYFLGWLSEALEVFVILVCLGVPTNAVGAVAIAALSVFVKGGTFMIPGSIGAQEGGNLVILMAFGYSELTGITFALLRRFRELVWIVIGLVSLAVIKERS
jgi:uncharacterized protein (TIRG00374 family)